MNKKMVRLAVLAAVVAALGACGSSTSTKPAAPRPPATTAATGGVPYGSFATITAMDYSYQVPATFDSGVTLLKLTNAGNVVHEFRFLRLHDGATKDAATNALGAKNRALLATLAESDGGVTVDPGQTARYGLDLKPGQYVVASTWTSGGTPDLAKGMAASFTVSATPGGGVPPSIDGTITMSDTSFDVPAGLVHGVYHIVNSGSALHEGRLFRLDPAKTLEDVRALFSPSSPPTSNPPAWLDEVNGGILELTPGAGAWLRLDLPSAHYVVLSFVKDPATRIPDVAKGMIADFTVS